MHLADFVDPSFQRARQDVVDVCGNAQATDGNPHAFGNKTRKDVAEIAVGTVKSTGRAGAPSATAEVT